jgi:hypothetical protein
MRGHAYTEGSFRWKADGARSCSECERIRRALNHDRIAEMQARRRKTAQDRRRFAEAALDDFRQAHHRRVA